MIFAIPRDLVNPGRQLSSAAAETQRAWLDYRDELPANVAPGPDKAGTKATRYMNGLQRNGEGGGEGRAHRDGIHEFEY